MRICVVGVACTPPDFLRDLSNIFSASIIFSSMRIPEEAYDPNRGQWMAERILNKMKEIEWNADRVVGILDVDIFVRGLNFVFGLAEIGGKHCVVSIFRLRTPDENLFKERVMKEVIHELGHTFGLGHCPNKNCVMSFSNSIKEVDRKGSNFCEECVTRLVEM